MIANTGKLAGKTLFVTGASRGIGLAIALKAAQDGANIVVAAKTKDPHPVLPGTIYTAAKEIEDAGGKALPCVVDIRNEKQVVDAVDSAVKKFGGIDILVNNASAISLTGTLETEMKKYDLMNNINARGTYLVSKTCLPHIKKSSNGHILNISPPLNMSPHWFKDHLAYTMAKYGMSMCALGMSEEFKKDGVAVNALWAKTAIATSVFKLISQTTTGADDVARKVDIMADAAYIILTSDAKSLTGKFLIDDELLKEAGLTDEQIDQYACNPGNKDNLLPDFFLDAPNPIAKIGVRSFSTSAALRSAEGKSGLEEVFNAIKGRLSADIVSSTQALIQFNLSTGDKEETWFIDLRSGEGSVGQGKPADAPDATLTMKTENFNKMFAGKLKPTSAFMTGKLKVSGNMQKAMKLEKLLTALKK